jgi:hypothetical protein
MVQLTRRRGLHSYGTLFWRIRGIAPAFAITAFVIVVVACLSWGLYDASTPTDALSVSNQGPITPRIQPTTNFHQSYLPLDCHQFLHDLRTNNNNTSPTSIVRPEHDLNGGKVFLRWMDQYDPPFWISTPQRDRSVFRTGIHPNQQDTTLYQSILQQQQDESFKNEKNPGKVVVVADPYDWGWFPLLAASLGRNVDVLHSNRTNMIRICESLRVNRWINQKRSSSSNSGSNNNNKNRMDRRTETLASASSRRPISFPPSQIVPSVQLYPLDTIANEFTKLPFTLDEFGQDGHWFSPPEHSSEDSHISILHLNGPSILQLLQGSQQLFASRLVKYVVVQLTTQSSSEAPAKFTRNKNNKEEPTSYPMKPLSEEQVIDVVTLLQQASFQPYQWKLWANYNNDKNKNKNDLDAVSIRNDSQLVRFAMEHCQTSCHLWWKCSSQTL